jgi:hypothetical protein
LTTDQVDVEVDGTVEGEEEVRNFRENFDPMRPDNLLSNLKIKKFFLCVIPTAGGQCYKISFVRNS